MKTVSDLFSLRGKRALVAGGAGLLGGQISETLAELGADLIIASRNRSQCAGKCAELAEAFPGCNAAALELDITSQESVSNCLRDIEGRAPGIDILVVCAWSGKKNDWDTISQEDWNYDIDVCLSGVFRLIKACTPALRLRQGIVLNIGSMYGHVAPDFRLYEGVPQANPPSYGAAKAGVIQLTKYLASYLAKDGIRVNCISPGPFPFPETSERFPEFAARLRAKNPMARLGIPHEIKGAAALLCSEASSYMTGQNICVDGGWAIW